MPLPSSLWGLSRPWQSIVLSVATAFAASSLFSACDGGLAGSPDLGAVAGHGGPRREPGRPTDAGVRGADGSFVVDADGTDAASDGSDDAAGDAGADAPNDAAPHPVTNVEHIVVIIQENHTFDTYFGSYCQAEAGSNPSCTEGPACCEAAPAIPQGSDAGPVVLGDDESGAFSPDHGESCELQEIDDGKMDEYVTSPICGSIRNVAMVPAPKAGAPSVVQPYLDFAKAGALADRYFQSVAGASLANDLYFASTRFEFPDDDDAPDSIGADCTMIGATHVTLTDPNLGALLNDAGVAWSFYAEGYRRAVQANAQRKGSCSTPDPSCPSYEIVPSVQCIYSASDNPFEFYKSGRDTAANSKDYTDLAYDLDAGTLPSVSFVKLLEVFTEHPGAGQKISAGVTRVQATIDAIEASPYASSTLIVVTWDEGGGYFDHVSPPAANPVDGQPYGARLPAIFIGPFAKPNTVSHVPLEHSSLVKFIEYNWLDGITGQLGGRDTTVNNIGSVLDPTRTGAIVP